MSVKMILQDGPLDGEQQLVLDLPTAPGSMLTFTMPNYQFFDDTGDTVIAQGLQVVYAFLEQGPAPVPPADTWDTSWIYEFAEEFFIPPPPFVPVPQPPQLPQLVSLEGDTGMVINASDPIPGVQMTGETDLEVDGDVTPQVGDATVTMSATTVLTAEQDVNSQFLSAQTNMIVSPS